MRLTHWTIVALCASSVAAQTFVVAKRRGPGVDFTNLAQAVATVPAGSVLHVRGGLYYADADIDKALTVIGSKRKPTIIEGNWTIGPTTATEAVVLSGMTFQSSTLAARNAAGPVILHNLDFGIFTSLLLDASRDVHLLGVEMPGAPTRTPPPPRLRIDNSRVEISDSTIEGTQPFGLWGWNAVEGILAITSRIVLINSTVVGGRGGACIHSPSCNGADGGIGIVLEQSSKLFALRSRIVGGEGAPARYFGTYNGVSGSGLVVRSSSVARCEATVPAAGPTPVGAPPPAWTEDASSEAHIGSGEPIVASLSGKQAKGRTITYRLAAQPGSVASLHFGDGTQHLPLEPLHTGSLFVELDANLGFASVPASGMLEISVVIPSWWPADTPVFAQWGAFAPGGRGWTSNSVMLLVPSGIDAVETGRPRRREH